MFDIYSAEKHLRLEDVVSLETAQLLKNNGFEQPSLDIGQVWETVTGRIIEIYRYEKSPVPGKAILLSQAIDGREPLAQGTSPALLTYMPDSRSIRAKTEGLWNEISPDDDGLHKCFLEENPEAVYQGSSIHEAWASAWLALNGPKV